MEENCQKYGNDVIIILWTVRLICVEENSPWKVLKKNKEIFWVKIFSQIDDSETLNHHFFLLYQAVENHIKKSAKLLLFFGKIVYWSEDLECVLHQWITSSAETHRFIGMVLERGWRVVNYLWGGGMVGGICGETQLILITLVTRSKKKVFY